MYSKRDSKDPMPTKENSCRDGKDGGGNTPVSGEKHDGAKGEHIKASSRYDGTVAGPAQPTRGDGEEINGCRQSGGNIPVDEQRETHDSKKAERIAASKRF
jgi:hypothetical protein